MADVAAHEEGGGSHEEVQHASGQDGDVGLLPGERLGGQQVEEWIKRESERTGGWI